MKIVWSLSVEQHANYSRETVTVPGVGVCVKNDTEAIERVCQNATKACTVRTERIGEEARVRTFVSKDRTFLGTLGRDPHCHPVTIKVGRVAADLQEEFRKRTMLCRALTPL